MKLLSSATILSVTLGVALVDPAASKEAALRGGKAVVIENANRRLAKDKNKKKKQQLQYNPQQQQSQQQQSQQQQQVTITVPQGANAIGNDKGQKYFAPDVTFTTVPQPQDLGTMVAETLDSLTGVVNSDDSSGDDPSSSTNPSSNQSNNNNLSNSPSVSINNPSNNNQLDALVNRIPASSVGCNPDPNSKLRIRTAEEAFPRWQGWGECEDTTECPTGSCCVGMKGCCITLEDITEDGETPKYAALTANACTCPSV